MLNISTGNLIYFSFCMHGEYSCMILEVICLVLFTMVVATQFVPQVTVHTFHWQGCIYGNSYFTQRYGYL